MIKKGLLIKHIIWFVVLLLLLGLGFYSLKQARFVYDEYAYAKEIRLKQSIHTARGEFYETLRGIVAEVQYAADHLLEHDEQRLENFLKKEARFSPIISAIGVAFEPYQRDSKIKNFSLYFVKEATDFKRFDLDRYYDYHAANWYRDALGSMGHWAEPFIEPSCEKSVLRFCSSIFKFDKQTNTRLPIGVIFIDLSRPQLNWLVNKSVQGRDDYVFLLSANDRLISYPIESYLTQYETLSNVSQLPGEQNFHVLSSEIRKKRGGISSYRNSITQELFLVAFEPMAIVDWFFVYVSRETPLFGIKNFGKMVFEFFVVFYLLLLFLLISFMRFITFCDRRWLISIFSSAYFLFLIFLKLYIGWNYILVRQKLHHEKVGSMLDLIRFKNLQTQRDKSLGKAEAVYIPTGISVNDISSQKQNQFEIKGVIWQKYGPGTEALQKNISFLKQTQLSLKELYKTQKNGVTTIGWSFSLLVDVAFNETTYPLSKFTLYINMIHPDFEKNIILVPDFESYKGGGASQIMGISPELKTDQSFAVRNTNFLFYTETTAHDFGLSGSTRASEFPNLVYSMTMEQNIISIFISYLLPLSIVAFILFYILIALGGAQAAPARLSLLGQTGALFLALIFSQHGLRSALKVNKITYLESLYFVMYGMTFTISSICLYLYQNEEAVDTVANFRYLFWPVFFGSILAITVALF